MPLQNPRKLLATLIVVGSGLGATTSNAQIFNLPVFELVMAFGQRAACEEKFPELRPLFAEAFESFVKLNEDQMPAASLRKLELPRDAAPNPLFENVSRESCAVVVKALATLSLRESSLQQLEFNAERRNSELIGAQLERGGRYRNSIGVVLASARQAVIDEVAVGSPAATAGLRVHDVVVAFNGNPIERASDLVLEVLTSSADSVIPLTVVRNGERITLRVKVARVERSNED